MIRFRTRASSGAERSGVGKVTLARLRFHGTEGICGSATLVFVIALGDLARTRREGRSQICVERDKFFRPGEPPAGRHDRVSHTLPGRLPFCGRTRRPGRRCTTFFPRHGFRSWRVNKTRMVSRPTRGTSFHFTACSAISRSRTAHRACPSGGWLQTIAMTRCFSEAFSNSWEPRPWHSYNPPSSPAFC